MKKFWLMAGVCSLALTFAGSAYAVDISLEDLDLDDAEITDNNTAAQAQDQVQDQWQDQWQDQANTQTNDQENNQQNDQDQFQAALSFANPVTNVILPDELGKHVLSFSHLSASVSGNVVNQGFAQQNTGTMEGTDTDLLDADQEPVFDQEVVTRPVMNNQMRIRNNLNSWAGVSAASFNTGHGGVSQSNVNITADIGTLNINPTP